MALRLICMRLPFLSSHMLTFYLMLYAKLVPYAIILRDKYNLKSEEEYGTQRYLLGSTINNNVGSNMGFSDITVGLYLSILLKNVKKNHQ